MLTYFIYSVLLALVFLVIILAIIAAFFWFLLESRCTFGKEPDKVVLNVPSTMVENLESFVRSYIASYNKNKLVVYDVREGYGGYHQIKKTIDYGSLYYVRWADNEFLIIRGSPNFSFGMMMILCVSFTEDGTVEIAGNKFLLPYKVRKNKAFHADFSGKLKKEFNTSSVGELF